MWNAFAPARALVCFGSLGLALVACGDGPICPSEIVVVLQSPASGSELSSADDLNADNAGIQVDISARSNLKEGDDFRLTITDSASAIAQYDGQADGDGNVMFSQVTLPAGVVQISITGTSEKCGSGTDEAEVTVITQALCDLAITEGPIDNDFYAPIPVLNSTIDSDANLPNFQANIAVQSSPEFDVELFVLDIEAGSEASIGTVTADAGGIANFEATLAQGRQAVRATCSKSGVNEASATHTVQVDTVVPSCELTAPAQGVTVNPDADEDGDDQNGIQMTWTGTVDDDGEGDTQGESSSFFRDTQEFTGTPVDADGDVSTDGYGAFTAPGTFPVRVQTQDHAANPCIGGFDVNVIMQGCTIDIVQPSATVVADSDGNGANGLQADFVVQVGTECAGRDVFVDCGQGELSATAPGDGATTIADVTLSASAVSQGETSCTARVVNSDGFQTSDTAPIAWDTQAPGVSLDFVDPASLACGDSLVWDVANDLNGDLSDGLQIDVRAIAPLATERQVTTVNASCPTPATAGCTFDEPAVGNTIRIGLQPGANDIRAVARDAVGNESTSPACNVIVADIAVTFGEPVSTGALGQNDADGGTDPTDGDLEITVCGTISENTVTMTLTVNGTDVYPATATGGTWCTDNPVVLAEGNHVLVVDAQSTIDSGVGTNTVNVTVDLTPPNPPTGLDASAPTRQSIAATWTASAGATGYLARYSTAPFVDFPNEGTPVNGVGSMTSTTVSSLNAGTEYYIGVAAVDAVGNMSDAATIGPIIPLFDQTGAITPPDFEDGNGKGFGYAVVSGNFNNDAYDDLAVSAPFTPVNSVAGAGVVYVFLGGPAGIGTTPDVTIEGPAEFAQFGNGLTRLNWGGGAGDGLAIGAPFANAINGGVWIFHDTTITAAAAGSGLLDTGDADMTIEVNGSDGSNWFASGAIGFSLASGQVNANATREDLIIGCPGGGGFNGGAVIIYGGTATGSDLLLSDDAGFSAGMMGLVGHYFDNPVAGAAGGLFGSRVAYLGDTRTGNGVGDVAISYFADDVDSVNDRVYVLRGRTSLPAAGIAETTFGGNDVAFENQTGTVDGTTSFGDGVTSIEDQNNDGFRDIVISAYRQTPGRLWILAGNLTGVQAITDGAGYLTRITGVGGTTTHFAKGLANNALGSGSDVNNDGQEDLVVAAGQAGVGNGVQLLVWFADDIPTGTSTAASASHAIDAPAEFIGSVSVGAVSPVGAYWAGDVNNDGFDDICWADWVRRTDPDPNVSGDEYQEGLLEVLWDDGI